MKTTIHLLFKYNKIYNYLYIQIKQATLSSEEPYLSSTLIKQRLKNITSSISIAKIILLYFHSKPSFK